MSQPSIRLWGNGFRGPWQVVRGLEDLVNGVHQDVSDYFPVVGVALYSEDEVINKDIGMGQRLRQRPVGSYLFRRWERRERSLTFFARCGHMLRGRWFGWRQSHLGRRKAL